MVLPLAVLTGPFAAAHFFFKGHMSDGGADQEAANVWTRVTWTTFCNQRRSPGIALMVVCSTLALMAGCGVPDGSGSSRLDSPSTEVGKSGAKLPDSTTPGKIDPTDPASPGRDGVRVDRSPLAISSPRLTQSQYEEAVRALVGNVSIDRSRLPADDYSETFSSGGAHYSSLSLIEVEQLGVLANQIAEQVTQSDARFGELTGCPPALEPQDPCQDAFFSRFLKDAFRQDVEPEIRARFVAVAEQASALFEDERIGIRYFIEAVLQSPRFIYRIERTKAGDNSRLDGFEMANLIAFTLWGGPPDAQLLDAARDQSLMTAEGIADQIDRMWSHQRTEDGIRRFFDELFDLRLLPFVEKDAILYPAISEALLQSMQDEVHGLLRRHALEDRNFLDVLTTTETHVDEIMADFYEVSATSEGETTSMPPERKGLLTTAGLLTLYSGTTRTSPTKRGVTVLRKLLCQQLPEPDLDEEEQARADEILEDETLSNRERAELHATDPECKFCHAAFDPVGLSLEHFSADGRYRETQGEHEIDDSVTWGNISWEGALELADVLRENENVPSCLVRQYFRFATGKLENDWQRQVLEEEVVTSFKTGGYRFKDMITAFFASAAVQARGGDQ